MRGTIRRRAAAVGFFILTAQMTGCFIAVEEIEDDDNHTTHSYSLADIPSDADDAYICNEEEKRLARYEEEYDRLCFANENHRWRTSCRSTYCTATDVYVHYMLSQNLGNSATIAVEAFDNRYYQGSPVSTVQISPFDASGAGKHAKATLYLDPGEYYLRAFIADEDESILPYSYSDLELVGDRPLGIYGALSSPKAIVVESNRNRWQDPTHIHIDKLFKKPGSSLQTDAYLRVKFDAEEVDQIEPNRNIIIQLHDELDFDRKAVFSMLMASEKLLISGQEGHGEVLTEELEAGRFYVFAFLDANGNGFYDDGELAQTHTAQDQARMISIRQKRTATVSLALTSQFSLPNL